MPIMAESFLILMFLFVDLHAKARAGFSERELSQVEAMDFLWPPYVIGQTIIFLPCGFFLLSSIYLSSFFPRLISAAAGWMSTIL